MERRECYFCRLDALQCFAIFSGFARLINSHELCLTHRRIPHIFTWALQREVDVKFGYYILNTYVPELDGGSREIYAKWLEQIDAAETLGFDSL